MFCSPLQLNKTIVLVTGGRDYKKRTTLRRFLDKLVREYNIVKLVAGECPTGADQFAKEWALERGIPYQGYPAEWDNFDIRPCIRRYRSDGTPYNASAGMHRNKTMLKESQANLIVATEGGVGTGGMVSLGCKAGITILHVDR